MPERYLGQTLGKYRIESLLGSGGFAWVFKGYDPELEIPVAIKVLKPQFAGDQAVVDRFKREASTAARLRHPNIIKIYAVGREKDAVYFVMDYLPSGLATRLEATQSLPEDYVLRVGVDVARALGFAHREGVIHRDIKVDNILFDSHGNAVVADFGIARAVSGYTNQTGTNMVVGTPQYFAPEQARAKALDGRADLYSLGVTLFRAATGRLPFEGEDWYEIARQHVEEPPPTPTSINPALSSEFEAIVLQCLSKLPDERPPTGEVLADTIQQVLQMRRDPSSANTLTVSKTPTSSGPRIASKPAVEPVSRKRLWSAAAVATLVVGGGIAALMMLPLGSRVGTGNAATDSLAADSSAVVEPPDSTVASDSQVPPLTGSPNPKVMIPGKSTPPTPGPKPRFGSIAISAPPEAILSVDDVVITGNRKDDLPPGQHLVRAVWPTVDDCPSSTRTRFVNVQAGATLPLTMTPQPCGLIEIRARGRSDGGTIWFAMQPEGQPKPGDTPLTPGAKVFPVGKYKLWVGMPACSEYSEDLEILPDQTITRTSIVLICPQTDRSR